MATPQAKGLQGVPVTHTLVLVHTVPPLLPVFTRLGAELLPGVQLWHILDEPLRERVRQRGSLTLADSERLLQHVTLAEEIGADVVLVTCSSISPAVDGVRPQVHIPVLKIDETMIARAVELGTCIGVVATAATTLEPTRQALLLEAGGRGRHIDVELTFVDQAIAALLAGDGATHDRLVKAAVQALMPRVDVIILAQASAARVLDVLPEAERQVPVLASPHLALERVRGILGGCVKM